MAKKSQEVAVLPVSEKLQVTTQPTPMDLIAQAIKEGGNLDQIEKLMTLQERWAAQQARRAFFESLSIFQSKMTEIKKTKGVVYQRKDGGTTSYKYATLGAIDAAIKIPLKDVGLTKRWEIKEDKDEIDVTCIITHMDGHSERTSLRGQADISGNKNTIQSRSSTITYLQRYTLIAALGLTTADTDDDGKGAAPIPTELPVMSEAQFSSSLKKLQDGTATVEKIKQHFRLTEDQEKAFSNVAK